MRTSALIFAGLLGLTYGPAPARAQKTTPSASNQSQSQNPDYQKRQLSGTSSTGQGRNATGLQSATARQSEEASDLLSATDQARNAILNYDKQDALEHVNHALAKAQEIMQQKPGRMVPIYDELSRYSVIGPVMQSRNRGYEGENQEYSQQNNSTGASQQAQKQTQQQSVARNDERPVGVQDVVGNFTSVDLDIRLAQDHLTAAKQALEKGDFGGADAALKAVQDGVDVASVSVDLPLARARENLILARESAMSGDQRETKVALRDAARSLREYARFGGSHSSQASALCTQIENASNSASQTSTTSSATQIENWWNQLASWTQNARS